MKVDLDIKVLEYGSQKSGLVSCTSKSFSGNAFAGYKNPMENPFILRAESNLTLTTSESALNWSKAFSLGASKRAREKPMLQQCLTHLA